MRLTVSVPVAWAAGYLHDVGKSALPREVLDKPGALSAEEWRLIQTHPSIGEDLVKRHWPDAPVAVVEAVGQHHERLDGRGYPSGVSALPLVAAIVAAADVYDALSVPRAYRPAPVGEAERCAVLSTLALPSAVLQELAAVTGLALHLPARPWTDAI